MQMLTQDDTAKKRTLCTGISHLQSDQVSPWLTKSSTLTKPARTVACYTEIVLLNNGVLNSPRASGKRRTMYYQGTK